MPRAQQSKPITKRGGSRRKEPKKQKILGEPTVSHSRARQRIPIDSRHLDRVDGFIGGLISITNYQKEVSASNKETHGQIMEAIEDLAEHIPEGDYIRIVGLLRDAYIKHDKVTKSSYTLRPSGKGQVGRLGTTVVWASHPSQDTPINITARGSRPGRGPPRMVIAR